MAQSEGCKVKFPVTIKHRKIEAKIYGKSGNYGFYRVAYYVAGKRCVRNYRKYAEAKTEAERICRELAEGSQAAGLTAKQSTDALAALQRLETLRQTTGIQVSLISAVTQFAEAAGKLNGRSLAAAVEGYLSTVANVKRMDLAAAVEEFIASDEPRTRAPEGQRAQISGKYGYNRGIQLRRFAAMFQNTAVCDLTKEHLEHFVRTLAEFSAKSRNHNRASLKQFMAWCVRKDYQSPTHRLGEADSMRPEHSNTANVGIYSAKELDALLGAAEGPMQAMIALGALAGLRTSELLRLDWADVWRVAGHIEITAQKAKTRQRRLVAIVPALETWLAPFRVFKSGKLWTAHEIMFQENFRELCAKAKVQRVPNGLRHSFCSYHFALHSNEGLTSAQAGNSPQMIHSNYKGLCTKTEAEAWFSVSPIQAQNVIPMSPQAATA